ncbi:MAG TPA: hypothetical protein VLH15_09760 [Dehalococcoidales bacterium]|nr:hypothetical protein [Dehalococcoidales bacterium]
MINTPALLPEQWLSLTVTMDLEDRNIQAVIEYPSFLIDNRNCYYKSDLVITKEETNMVTKISGKYIIDDKGKTISVILDIKTYRRLIAELEELESIRAYDAAKASCDEAIPFDLAVQKIEKSP